MSRKEALRRIQGLMPRVEQHLAKLIETPSLFDDRHWRHEMNNWLSQIEAAVPHVGNKTAAYWQDIIDRIKQKGGQP